MTGVEFYNARSRIKCSCPLESLVAYFSERLALNGDGNRHQLEIVLSRVQSRVDRLIHAYRK